VTAILEKANLPADVELKMDPVLGATKCYAVLPSDTIANLLQLIANAIGCVLYQDRIGNIHIEPLNISYCTCVFPPDLPAFTSDVPHKAYIDSTGDTHLPNTFVSPNVEDIDYEINSSNSYSKPEISLSKPLRLILCKSYTYIYDDDTKESEVTYERLQHPSIPKINDGDTITVDNPLIQSGNYYDVSSLMYSYLKNRKTLELSWRPDVRLDALDFVKVPNKYTTDRVLMTDIEYTYNGAFRATGKGRVIENG
jgi:hypothetical protein